MKKNQLFTLLIILFALSIKSQKIQTYNGPFEKGVATYEYYENESLERVFNGNFNYKSNDYEVVGQFKNNKRDGKWKVVILNEKCYTGVDAGKIFSSVTIASYIEGNLNGHCSFEKTDIKTKKIFSESSANFKNNIMVDDFKYKSPTFSLDAKLNNYGFLDSTLRLINVRNGTKFEHIRKYNDGYMYFELSRNLSNGEILSKLDFTKFYDSYFKNVDKLSGGSIISYFEFQNNNEIPPSILNVTKTKNENSFYLSNVPVTSRKAYLDAESNSDWSLAFIIDFWTARDISHAVGGNPLNFMDKGINPANSMVIKIPSVDGKKHESNIVNDNFTKNKLTRIQLLDSLKIAVQSHYVFLDLKNGIDPPFVISTTLISSSQMKGYKTAMKYSIESYPDKYIVSEDFIKDNNKIREIVNYIIKKEDWQSGTGDFYDNKPKYYDIKDVEKISSWLGYKIASEKQINCAKENKVINPLLFDFGTFYFTK